MHFANGLLVDNKIEIDNIQYQISEVIFHSKIKTASFEDKYDVAGEIHEWYLRHTDEKIIGIENPGK